MIVNNKEARLRSLGGHLLGPGINQIPDTDPMFANPDLKENKTARRLAELVDLGVLEVKEDPKTAKGTKVKIGPEAPGNLAGEKTDAAIALVKAETDTSVLARWYKHEAGARGRPEVAKAIQERIGELPG